MQIDPAGIGAAALRGVARHLPKRLIGALATQVLQGDGNCRNGKCRDAAAADIMDGPSHILIERFDIRGFTGDQGRRQVIGD
ncbi:MAG: hypothetical protein AAGA70_03255 [Pseudomonadota bacterium]